MDNVIKLFNPTDKPFGKLSNNSYHPMTIDGEKWNTVTNYILANMLTTPSYKKIIQNADIKGVKKTNTQLLNAIDFLINLEKREVKQSRIPFRRFPSKGTMIKRLVSETEKLPEFFESWSIIDIRNRYSEITKKPYQQVGRTGENKLENEQIWGEIGKSDHVSKMTKEKRDKEKYIAHIIREVQKPFETIDLNMLKKKILEESEIHQMGIYKLYESYIYKEIYNIVRNAVERGFESRFSNPKMATFLLSTGNSPIRYESKDPILGGDGGNVVGIILEQIRHRLRIQKVTNNTKEEKKIHNDRIYEIYIAYLVLKKEMKLGNDLKNYLGLNPRQIIQKFGKENLSAGVPSKETVLAMYENNGSLNDDIMTEIFNPGTLVINVRKNGIEGLKINIEEAQKDLIFNSYLRYIVKKKYPNISEEDIDVAIQQQSNTGVSSEQRLEVKKRIISLFRLGMLSANLSDQIDQELKELQVPSEDDIAEALAAEVPLVKQSENISVDNSGLEGGSESSDDSNVLKKLLKSDDKQTKKDLIMLLMDKIGGTFSDYDSKSKKDLRRMLLKQKSDTLEKQVELLPGLFVDEKTIKKEYEKPSGTPVVIFPNPGDNKHELAVLSPVTFTGMLTIDGKMFPTISHYIITRLLAFTGTRRVVDDYGVTTMKKGFGMNEAYKVMLVDYENFRGTPEGFITLNEASRRYDEINKETSVYLASTNSLIAMNKKFENKSLQNLLLLTGNAKIEWVDPGDLFLGVGTSKTPGENYVGSLLERIRSNIEESREGIEEVEFNTEDIKRIILNDKFVSDWVRMRLKDMCEVVHKMYYYIKENDGFDEPIDDEFVKFVLDTIFMPCIELQDNNTFSTTVVPEWFLDFVENCPGMKISKIKIYNEVGKYQFYVPEIQQKQKEIERRVSELKQEFYSKNEIKHTKEEMENFRNYQIEEWDKFMTKLTNPKMSKEEIESNDRKFAGYLKDRGSVENFNKKERAEWRKYQYDLASNEISIKDRNEEMKNFKEYQKGEEDDFFGIEDNEIKSSEDFLRHKGRIKQIRQEFTDFVNKKKKIQKHEYLSLKSIAQIYWNRIYTMVRLLVSNVKPSTGSNIRETLSRLELLTTEPVECVRYVDNNDDNCTISAMINLLRSISAFKSVKSNSVLNKNDVNLAGSIIMNSNFVIIGKSDFEKREFLVDFKEEDLSELSDLSDIQDSDEEHDSDKSVHDSDSDKSVHDSDSERSVHDSDIDFDFLFPEDQKNKSELPQENPYFLFNGGEGDIRESESNVNLAKIEESIDNIDKQSNSRQLAMDLMVVVRKIRNDKMSSNVKQSRINYFATIE